MFDPEKYSSFIFDCDGVILDSNKIKTSAFYATALPYGEDAANRFVEYHVNNGGVSRYEKFRYFLTEILNRGIDNTLLENLISQYAEYVSNDLMTCPIAERIPEIRHTYQHTRWFIVSGGDQEELRSVFARRNIGHYFDGGIYGSPDQKEVILSREIDCGNISLPALFLGDSLYDYKAASSVGMDFIFVSGWTEVKDWMDYQSRHGFPHIDSVADLVAGNSSKYNQ